MAIDWGLAPKPLDYLSSLQAFDMGRQRSAQDAALRRESAVRTAKVDYWNQTHPIAAPAPVVDPAAPATPVSIHTAALDRSAISPAGAPSAAALAQVGAPVTAPPPGQSSYVSQLVAPAAPAPVRAAPGAAALNRIAAANPDEAMKMEGEQLKMTKEKLDTYQAVNAASLQLMGGVHDQASYDAAKARAHAIHDQYGVGPDALALPDQYDPQVVKGLMMQAMKTSDQLNAMRADTRLNWTLEDGRLDNARADRNIDSTIDHRRAQEGLTARGQDLTDARGRYGIGVSSSDRRRGQDVSASTQQRGQDISSGDRRRGQDLSAEAAKFRRSNGVKPTEPVATDGKGNHIVFRNGKWGPAQ